VKDYRKTMWRGDMGIVDKDYGEKSRETMERVEGEKY